MARSKRTSGSTERDEIGQRPLGQKASIARLRGRGRPKVMPDETQSKLIIEDARQLFIERGYGGTTMNDVVARCHVSKRTLYRLFPNKPALFARIVDLHRHSMLALPGDYADLALHEALERIFQIDIDPEADLERIRFLKLVLLEARQYPEVRDIVHEHGIDRSRVLLAQWLKDQRGLGRIAVADTGQAATMLMDIIFGAVVLKTGTGPEWPGGEDRAAYIRLCIHIFLNGVSSR